MENAKQNLTQISEGVGDINETNSTEFADDEKTKTLTRSRWKFARQRHGKSICLG